MLQSNVSLRDAACSNIDGAIDYLLQAKDHNGKVRAGVEILFGDKRQLAAVCNSMRSKHRYHSSVLAFTPADAAKLDDDRLEMILQSYLSLLACALGDTSRLSVFAVKHIQDDGGFHVHVLAAKQDLESGKHYDPFVSARGDIARYHQWVQIINHDFGLDDPNAVERKRELSFSKNLPKSSKDAIESIASFVSEGIKDGSFSSRRDVIRGLHKVEGLSIAKVGKQHISVRVKGFKRNLRLKGGYYDQSFSSIEALARAAEAIADQDIEAIRSEFQQRSETLKCRYGPRFGSGKSQDHCSTVDILSHQLISDFYAIEQSVSKHLRDRYFRQRNRIGPVDAKPSHSNTREHRELDKVREGLDSDIEQRRVYRRMQNTLDALTLICGTYRWNISGGRSWAVRESSDGTLLVQGSESSWRAAAAVANSKCWTNVTVQTPTMDDALIAVREMLRAGLQIDSLIVDGKPIIGLELRMLVASTQTSLQTIYQSADRISFA